ncbi:MAG: type II toxin-antitoxin system VapC family toxin [Micropruina sp.]|uniref:type II toxin-antitoxin system VapC family toxin n=1 Tax=Micropruina sp. TaxID=2737536 RepID=UPI0039E5F524
MSSVPLVYVDTSAFGALLVSQAQTEALVKWLDAANVRLVSSDLLETELRRMAVREGRDQARVSAILDGVALAALDRATYRSAGFLPLPYLRTLDALHLEAAIRLDADAILTYDHRLAEAAATTGLDVIAPSAPNVSQRASWSSTGTCSGTPAHRSGN